MSSMEKSDKIFEFHEKAYCYSMKGDFGNSNKLILFSIGKQYELGTSADIWGKRPQQERTDVLPEMKRTRELEKVQTAEPASS